MVKYKITSLLLIGDAPALVKAIFPNYNGEPTWFDQSEITVIFDTEQSSIDLGPLIKVEIITE